MKKFMFCVFLLCLLLISTSCGVGLNGSGFIVSEDSETGMNSLAGYRGNETDWVIPDSVSGIDSQAFADYTELVSVTFGENSSIMHIGESAFSGCVNLTNITIPNSVISIAPYAFENCHKLQYNEYENAYYLGNEENPYHALIKAKSQSIISCNIHPNTKIIAGYAFEDCEQLKNVNMPDGIINIGYFAFIDCENINYTISDGACYLGNGSNPYVALVDTTSKLSASLTVNSKTKVIADSALFDEKSLTDIVIPASVVSIGDGAFCNCTNLKRVSFGENSQLTRIGAEVFKKCENLVSITLPNEITTIGWGAFSHCTNLTYINLPESLIYVGSYTFFECNNLTIQCVSNKKPESWHKEWNATDCTVIWGYNID